jgi:ABC-type transport system involved in multi-copper enzyme maturation permease subunit
LGGCFCPIIAQPLADGHAEHSQVMLLVAIAFLFSTVSTSFFLPVFGTVAIFLVGSASQEAYDFVTTESGQKLPQLVKVAAKLFYYLLPNFSAFDLKLNAIYGLPVSFYGLILTLIYFLVYTAIVLFIATLLFAQRELK